LEQARKIYNDAKDKVNAAAQKQPKRKRSQQLQTIEEETQLNDIIAQALVATPKDQPTILNDNGTLKFSAEELKFYVMEPKKQKMLQAALEQSPQLLVQMIHEPDLRTFIESNAQKNPELWLTALIKARDEKLSVADQQSVEKLQNTTIDIIMKHMIESADKNKAGIMQNALIQFLELTKNSPSQRANQIKIIESFSKKGFTDATALATAMVVSRFTRTLDFNRLDTNQRAILMDAATKMMQKETAPQPWYGLLMLDKIMSNSPEQVTIDQTLSNTIQKKFTEALEKKVTLGNINLGKFFINEIASIATYNNAIISLFEALLKIATAKKQDIFTSADITQLKSFLKIRKDALQKKLPIKQTDKTPKNTSTIPEEETGMTQQQKDEKEAELIKIMMHGGQLL
jgi:hypothetical protein